jgi:hypothetical protein
MLYLCFPQLHPSHWFSQADTSFTHCIDFGQHVLVLCTGFSHEAKEKTGPVVRRPYLSLPATSCMYVCMYVCVRGGTNQPLHRDVQWSIVLPPSLVIPLVVPHYEYSAGFYTRGRRNSHLVPWNIGPGDGISSELEPRIHTGYVWPLRFLSDTCHKWDCCLVPVWKDAHWGDSVLWAVPPPIAAGLFSASTILLLF